MSMLDAVRNMYARMQEGMNSETRESFMANLPLEKVNSVEVKFTGKRDYSFHEKPQDGWIEITFIAEAEAKQMEKIIAHILNELWVRNILTAQAPVNIAENKAIIHLISLSPAAKGFLIPEKTETFFDLLLQEKSRILIKHSRPPVATSR